jgi:hypothetical protein
MSDDDKPHEKPDEARSAPLDAALRQELLDMQARDQEMRNTITARYGPGVPIRPEDVAWWESVDAANTARMKQIIAEHGWPGASLVGKEGAFAAWLLVQHADKDVPFQKRCLGLLEAAVASGEASLQNLAFLIDRVRVREGQPQVYGTQMTLADGAFVAAEIENPTQVDERRAAVGLGPLAEYTAQFKR